MPVDRRRNDARRPFGHEQQHAVVLVGELRKVERAIRRIVETRDGRPVALDHDLAQRLETWPHVLERAPDEGIVLRQVGEELHRHFGDVAEGALVADDHMPDVGADRTARHVLDARHRAVRETRPRGRPPCPRCRHRVSRTGRCCVSQRVRPSGRSVWTAVNVRSSRRACGLRPRAPARHTPHCTVACML